MDDESHSIQKNGTWKLVDLPEGKQAISFKWIYKNKFRSNGSIKHHKTHLITKGFKQMESINYRETFAPITNMNTIKIVMALVVQCKWPVY